MILADRILFLFVKRIMRAWIHKKFTSPLLAFIQKGASVSSLSWALALGVVLGLFPIPGTTTLLCLLVALIGGYNVGVMQLVNYLIYPLQLILILPLMALGSSILGLEMNLFSLSAMMDLFQDDFWKALSALWIFQLAGIFAWAIFVLPVSLLLYYVFKLLIKQIAPSS